MDIEKIRHYLDNFNKYKWDDKSFNSFVALLKNLDLNTIDEPTRRKVSAFLDYAATRYAQSAPANVPHAPMNQAPVNQVVNHSNNQGLDLVKIKYHIDNFDNFNWDNKSFSNFVNVLKRLEQNTFEPETMQKVKVVIDYADSQQRRAGQSARPASADSRAEVQSFSANRYNNRDYSPNQYHTQNVLSNESSVKPPQEQVTQTGYPMTNQQAYSTPVDMSAQETAPAAPSKKGGKKASKQKTPKQPKQPKAPKAAKPPKEKKPVNKKTLIPLVIILVIVIAAAVLLGSGIIDLGGSSDKLICSNFYYNQLYNASVSNELEFTFNKNGFVETLVGTVVIDFSEKSDYDQWMDKQKSGDVNLFSHSYSTVADSNDFFDDTNYIITLTINQVYANIPAANLNNAIPTTRDTLIPYFTERNFDIAE